MNRIPSSERMPFLALRGLNVFPGLTVHFDVGREKSTKALEKAMSSDNQLIFLVTQRDIREDNPLESDLYTVGTVAHVKQMLKLPSDTTRVLIEGLYRARILAVHQSEPYFSGRVEYISVPEVTANRTKVEALIRSARGLFTEFLMVTERSGQELMLQLVANDDPGFTADYLAQYATFGYNDKQLLLELLPPVKRLEQCIRMMTKELDVLRLESELDSKVQESMERNQRDYFLREQMKVIRDELGESDDEEDADHYRTRIRGLKLSEDTESKLLKEVSRLLKQPAGSSEAAVIRNYLDTVLELPWNTRTKERTDVAATRKKLDADHYGLEKVKERILEYVAVRQLAPELNSQVLCLVGPPGVGKTSIGMSIAQSMNRKLARISLGGVHDEADIRGHRKTYIGAMPGRIIAAMQQAGSNNPVLLLDEIDKMGSDYRGDPSSALLEVFDSEQNSTFRDHYLEIPFDLSGCVFITTANTTETIPRALLDRMDVIELGSYTDEEKLCIAKKHLVPKQLKKHGIKRTQLRLSDDALRAVIDGYTRESGVRNLERRIADICRKAAMQFVEANPPEKLSITPKNLDKYLGVVRYQPERKEETAQVGLVTGLAWTSVGGTTLEVEVNVVDGTGKFILTGNLGEVMKESVSAALSYIRSRAEALRLETDFYNKKDIHVHFPEGAVPKDGPSAGITVCTAIVSALTGIPVRNDIAMTGEISIRGRVMPIGGLKEKTMAALRHGINTVIIPQDNVKDLEEIDPLVRKRLHFVSVKQADEVLEQALLRSPFTASELPADQVSILAAMPDNGRKIGIRQ